MSKAWYRYFAGSSNSIQTYFGCRNIDRRRTKGDFAKIKEKINSKLASWNARVLSQAGKTVLLKSNLTGIPLFLIHGTKIPNYMMKEINSVNMNFSGIII